MRENDSSLPSRSITPGVAIAGAGVSLSLVALCLSLTGCRSTGQQTRHDARHRGADVAGATIEELPRVMTAGGEVREREPAFIMKTGSVQVDGIVERSALARRVRWAARYSKTCYERLLLKSRRPVAGEIVVEVSIDATGRPTAVGIQRDSFHNPQLSTCIKATVRRVRFPAPQGGPAKLIVPFTFHPTKRRVK